MALRILKIQFARLSVAIMLLGLLWSGCQKQSATGTQATRLIYPRARKDSIVDVYHGVKVPDPYRWLEDADSAETQAWVAEQNKLTSDFLAAIAAREEFETRLTNLLDYPRYSAPSKEGGRYFFWKNDGLQNQSVFYMQEALWGRPTVVINPNLLSADGTVAVTRATLSRDGTLLAYALSRRGSDRQEIKIRNIDTGEDYNEVLEWCRYTSIAWKHNKEGFFYNRYPEPNTVPPEDLTNYNRVYWHKLETSQSEDILIYERPDNKELHLALHVYHGTDPKNRVYYRPTEGTEPFIRLLDDADAGYDFIGNVGPIFYFETDLNAPRGKTIAIDTRNPAKENWRTVLSQQKDVIDYVGLINNSLVVIYLHDVHHQAKIYNLDGAFVRQVTLPTLGRVRGLSGRQDDTEMFFSFT
ncbi:MAG: prolyl oligopeptidase family protein, partial [Planctomycetota bacterium]